MKIIPIADVFAMDPDDIVDAVVGTITGIWKQSAGQNGNGDWALQNLTLTDTTGEIKVQLKDRDPLPLEWKGRPVLMYCNQGDRGKTGMKAKNDTYKQKTTRILSVTPTAHIEQWSEDAVRSVMNGTPQAPPPPQQHAPPPPPPTQQRATPAPPAVGAPSPAPFGSRPAPPPPATPPTPAPAPPATSTNGKHPVTFARERLGKATNALLLCFDAAAYVGRNVHEKHGITLGASDLKEIAVHFNITLSREGVDMGLPSSPINEQ